MTQQLPFGQNPFRERHEFVNDLQQVVDDPMNALSLMNDRLVCNLYQQLGFNGSLTEKAYKAAEKQEAVKGLGETILFLSKFGTLPPSALGIWLVEPNFMLWRADEKQTPLQVVWNDLVRPGRTRQNIERVIKNPAAVFLRPTEGFDSALDELIG